MMMLLTGNNKRIAYSVERLAFRKTKDIFFSLLFPKRYPLSANKSPKRYPPPLAGQALNPKSGFTLLELLLVISIILSVLMISMPLFRKTFSDIQLSSCAQDMVSLMRYAQERAIIEKNSLRFNIDTEKGSYWLTMRTADKEIYNRLSDKFGRQYNIAEGLKMESQEGSIDFYPDGEVSQAKIKISNQNKKSISLHSKSNVGSGITVAR